MSLSISTPRLSLREMGVHHPEIGYLIHRPFWRRGYASEAAEAVREHAFHVLGHSDVISMIRPENIPSGGAARRLGMEPWRDVNWRGFTHTIWQRSK